MDLLDEKYESSPENDGGVIEEGSGKTEMHSELSQLIRAKFPSSPPDDLSIQSTDTKPQNGTFSVNDEGPTVKEFTSPFLTDDDNAPDVEISGESDISDYLTEEDLENELEDDLGDAMERLSQPNADTRGNTRNALLPPAMDENDLDEDPDSGDNGIIFVNPSTLDFEDPAEIEKRLMEIETGRLTPVVAFDAADVQKMIEIGKQRMEQAVPNFMPDENYKPPSLDKCTVIPPKNMTSSSDELGADEDTKPFPKEIRLYFAFVESREFQEYTQAQKQFTFECLKCEMEERKKPPIPDRDFYYRRFLNRLSPRQLADLERQLES